MTNIEMPPVLTEPIYNEGGFGIGFQISHPPGVECVFPPNTRRCSCGKMDLGIVPGEQSPVVEQAPVAQSPQAPSDDAVLTPRKAFEIADYLCSTLSPLAKESVRDDLAALKIHLWDVYQASRGAEDVVTQ